MAQPTRRVSTFVTVNSIYGNTYLCGLVLDELAAGNTKDVIKLLKGPLLSLWDEEEDHEEGDDVLEPRSVLSITSGGRRQSYQSSVEAERTDFAEGGKDGRERDREDCGPEEAGGYSPAHADFSV